VTEENEDAPGRVKAMSHERASQVFEELCTVEAHEVGGVARASLSTMDLLVV